MLTRSITQTARVLCTTIYLINLVLTIPIAFQIGGIECGLLFTVTLFNIYFLTTTLKVLFFNNNNDGNNGFSKSYSYKFFYYLQHLYIPPILIIFLYLFSKTDYPIGSSILSDSIENSIASQNDNLSLNQNHILLSKTVQNLTFAVEKIWPYYIKLVMTPWKWIILHSTPYFTLLEGVFTILAIQTIGEAFKWLNAQNTLDITSGKSKANGGSITNNSGKILKNKNKSKRNRTYVLTPEEKQLQDMISETGSLSEIFTSDSSSNSEEQEEKIMEDNGDFDEDYDEVEEDGDEEDDDLSDVRSITSISSTTQEKSNLWSILGLLFGASVITVSLYYLYKIYATPNFTLSVIEASLIGFTFSAVCAVGLYGIVSGKGSVVESSLLFAYVIRCIYEISPVLSDEAMKGIMHVMQDTWSQVNEWTLLPNGLPPIKDSHHFFLFEFFNNALKTIKTPSYSSSSSSSSNDLFIRKKNLWDFIQIFTTKVFPHSIVSIYKVFGKMVKESITPSVLTNLSFRLLVFYSATRIIPALQKMQKREKELEQQHQEIVDEYLKPMSAQLVSEVEQTLETSLSETITINQEEGEAKELSVIREQQKEKLKHENNRNNTGTSWMDLIYLYSPCILIAMYTHLILQYSRDDGLENKICVWGCWPFIANSQQEVKVDSWGFWNWVNIFTTVFLYAFELKN